MSEETTRPGEATRDQVEQQLSGDGEEETPLFVAVQQTNADFAGSVAALVDEAYQPDEIPAEHLPFYKAGVAKAAREYAAIADRKYTPISTRLFDMPAWLVDAGLEEPPAEG